MSLFAKSKQPADQLPLTADQTEAADAALRDLLAADTVLPEQFWQALLPSSERSGELALMWAVFTDGIDCYRRNLEVTTLQGRIDFEEAEAWIFASEWDWPFSFVNLCEIFGFSPNSVRWTLQQWKREHRTQKVRRHRFRPVTRHAA